MGKISDKRRKFEIKKRIKRIAKLRKLKEKYFSSKSKEEKEKIIQKMKRIAFHLQIEEYLGIKNKQSLKVVSQKLK